MKQSALEKIPNEVEVIKQSKLEKISRDGFENVQDINEDVVEKIVDDKADDTKPSEKIADETQCTKPSESESASDWSIEFERQKREIIELWDICNIPLVHRTYFFLLFNGDPSDAIYMEVELRRLSFLNNTLHGATSIEDGQFTRASSLKALNREREMLSKQMLKKTSTKEREAMYEKWGIDLKSKKRRLQLCRRLWTEATDMEHVRESASVVAKLVGLKEPGQAPKEMVGLSFSQRTANFRSFSWKNSLPSMI